MKNIKALFVDCDGVLYDKQDCTYHDMAVIGFGEAMNALNIPHDELAPTRAKLKEMDVHGLFNAALVMCQKRNIPFDLFAQEMVKKIDYSRIPDDKEMLRLLHECGSQMPVYVVTNNTRPHLQKILNRLNGNNNEDISVLNVHPIAIEDTFCDGFFHPKKTGRQLTELCSKIGLEPRNVLLLDDTKDVCDAALAQGLQIGFIEKPNDTKIILRRIIHEKSKPERVVAIRKTRGGLGD